MAKKRVAVSIGDLNGIGLELALINHKKVCENFEPIYFIDKKMLKQGAELLNLEIPSNFATVENIDNSFQIQPAKVSAESGKYSFSSFKKAVEFVESGKAEAVITLPINKESWDLANFHFKGHTDFLRDYFKKDAIMLMGVPEMYVALFTEHIPYKDVPKFVTANNLYTFMKNLLNSQPHLENIAVLGLNPHSGDNGVLGDEEVEIRKAVNKINDEVGKNIFSQPIVPDIAFTSEMRKKFNFYIAIYHDQGLIPLKTLYFDDAINISLNLPIVRISVGHGTAFNIAYQKERVLNSASYLNTFNYFRNL